MTREEVKSVLKYMASVYPTFKPDNVKATVDAWSELLENTDYQIFMIAVKRTIMANNTPFAPTIGQLREQYQVEYRMSHKNDAEIEDGNKNYIPMPEEVRRKLQRFRER